MIQYNQQETHAKLSKLQAERSKLLEEKDQILLSITQSEIEIIALKELIQSKINSTRDQP